MAKVTLVRKKQFAGSAAKMKVFINGELKGILSPSTQNVFEVEGSIHNIKLVNTMSETSIMTDVKEEDIITLEFSAWSGKVKAYSVNGNLLVSRTKMSGIQIAFQVMIFILAFIAGYILFM